MRKTEILSNAHFVIKNYQLRYIIVEDSTYIISSCSKVSTRYYLLWAWYSCKGYITIPRKDCSDVYMKDMFEPACIHTSKNKEYWWNTPIEAAIWWHNRLDIVPWDRKQEPCTDVEVNCTEDVNVSSKVEEKERIYGKLKRNPDNKLSFLSIHIDALGKATTNLHNEVFRIKSKRNWHAVY